MRGWLDQALRGERQTAFVTGEPGIGKTTVVNAVLERAASVQGLRIARGQCLEQYGAGEGYLPVLDGFSRLGRAPGGERVITLLRHHAPAWLLQPAVASSGRRARIAAAPGPGATRERMLREAADLVEAMAAEAPFVLVLEDLHWSDYSTLDLVAYLARRRDAGAVDGDRHLPAGRRNPGRASAEERQARVAGARPLSRAAARVPDRGGGRAVCRGEVSGQPAETAGSAGAPPLRKATRSSWST